MIIQAKFASVCPCCSQRIAVGSKVEWVRGEKAKHVACKGATAASRTYRQASDYTLAKRAYAATGDYYGSGLYDEES